LDHVELDSIQDRVVTDGSRMSRTFAEGLSIMFAGLTHVRSGDRVERDQVDRVDLNVGVADRIHATNSHSWPLPKAKGDGDAARDDLVAELSTEKKHSLPFSSRTWRRR
jgi:hypothetical protein